MNEERAKLHMIRRHGENTVSADGVDISGELAILHFPDADCALTECGHLYDPGITTVGTTLPARVV
jgi:hypothetical protein